MRLLDPGALAQIDARSLDEVEAGAAGARVRVGGDTDPKRVLARMGELSSVTVVFGAFKDGRGFSLASMLRGRGFTGELVAVGDLLADQALYLARCGFDAVELPPGALRAEWEAGLQAFSTAYQTAAQPTQTVWARRAARRDAETPALEVDTLNERFRGASAEALLQAVIGREFPGRVALLSSFGAEAAVTLHLVSRVDPATPVLFLDTDRHFAPTLQYHALLVERLGLKDVRVLRPQDAEADDPDGQLWARDPDRCCDLRKVRPLAAAAAEFKALITGRKRMHGGGRARLRRFELQDGRLRVNPLADWTAADIEAYFRAHALPRHPLVQAGYSSIGCWPCTEPTGSLAGDRSGRWAGREKTECGIHLAGRLRAPAAEPAAERASIRLSRKRPGRRAGQARA